MSGEAHSPVKIEGHLGFPSPMASPRGASPDRCLQDFVSDFESTQLYEASPVASRLSSLQGVFLAKESSSLLPRRGFGTSSRRV